MTLCTHFPACGGCSFQNISYDQQLQTKQSFIENLFPSVNVLPILACKNPWRYRNKMEFSFSQNRKGDRFLGLMLKKSKGKVFNLQECWIAPEHFSQILSSVFQWWRKTPLTAFHPHSGEGTLRTLTLRRSSLTKEIMVMLTVSGNPRFAISKLQMSQFVEAVQGDGRSVFLQVHQAIPKRPTQFFELHLAGPTHLVEHLVIHDRKFLFKISPASFFQPNTEQAQLLYQTALEFVSLKPDDCVMDLYCGTATLGILCAPRVKQVIGIEQNPYAICDGEENCQMNHLSNVTLYQGDVAKVLASNTLPRPSLIILDPPRAGLDPHALQLVQTLNSPQILYISCNPVTQAANLRSLVGYKLKHVQPVDQFPHTPHVENICHLVMENL